MTKPNPFVSILCLLGLLTPGAFSQKPSNADSAGNTFLSARQTFKIRFESDPHPIPRNEPFTLEIWILDRDGNPPDSLTLHVDARMPDHRHGMVRVPKITALAPGHFKVTNMLFHMPGRWVLHFDMTHQGLTERGSFEVNLE